MMDQRTQLKLLEQSFRPTWPLKIFVNFIIERIMIKCGRQKIFKTNYIYKSLLPFIKSRGKRGRARGRRNVSQYDRSRGRGQVVETTIG